MSLESLTDVLAAARLQGRAAVGLSCYDLATAAGAIGAAERRRSPIVLIVSVPALATAAGPGLLAGLRQLAGSASVPVAVQLDHVAEADSMATALEAGANALMADGSRLPLEQNVELVRGAIGLARGFGAEVEAELGHLEGDEEVGERVVHGELTEPDEVPAFLERTGAHCLAVAVGNVHGFYRGRPRIDWGRLEAITAVADRPISLHGASGLAPDELRRAVVAGVAKVNFNTEMRQRWIATAAAAAEAAKDGARLLDVQSAITASAASFVAEAIEALTVLGAAAPAAGDRKTRMYD